MLGMTVCRESCDITTFKVAQICAHTLDQKALSEVARFQDKRLSIISESLDWAGTLIYSTHMHLKI